MEYGSLKEIKTYDEDSDEASAVEAGVNDKFAKRIRFKIERLLN